MEVIECKHDNRSEQIGTEFPDKYGRIVCDDCGANLGWLPNPNNAKKRRDENQKWRPILREKSGGQFVCFVCGWIEDRLPKRGFDVHHIKPLSEGGEDSIGNVRMLCAYCHKIWHALRDASRLK
jgi:hypothetical protein